MEQIPGVSLPMIDEAKQALIHMAGCLEDALAVSEESRSPLLLNPKTVIWDHNPMRIKQ